MERIKYERIKNILSGINNCNDAIRMIKYLKEDENEIVNNLVRSMKFNSEILSYNEINERIKEIDNIKYEDEYEKYLNEMKEIININDIVQLNVINRLGNSKIIRKNKTGNPYEKSCPHCGHLMVGTSETEYVICGIKNEIEGYDGIGCLRDWCFKCGKKLCKSWGDDNLRDERNREHNDGKCCKIYSILMKENYEKEYCHCGIHIFRKKSKEKV